MLTTVSGTVGGQLRFHCTKNTTGYGLQHETKKALLCVVLIYGTDCLHARINASTVFTNGYNSLPAATGFNNYAL